MVEYWNTGDGEVGGRRSEVRDQMSDVRAAETSVFLSLCPTDPLHFAPPPSHRLNTPSSYHPRRVPAGLNPVPSHGDRDHIVQLQCADGCSTAGRSSFDFRSVVYPPKMIGPTLSARVEKGHIEICFGITRGYLVGFEAVAESAGEPQVIFCIRTAAASRDQVLDLERPQYQVLGTQAVPTSIAGLFPDALPNFFGNIPAHD